MTALVALIRREFLEHRGAFMIAPIVLIGLFTLAGIGATFSGHGRLDFNPMIPEAVKFFEIGYGGFALLWWVYLLAALFFYFADAFSADKRNNAMLFWKSMPQSDFKILGSKLLAGGTIFPTLIFLALLVTSVLMLVLTIIAALRLGQPLPDPVSMLQSFGGLTLAAVVYFFIGLLWYAPFFAWVGGLSAVVGRWSMPLAFLVPGVLIVMENAAFRGAPYQGGYIWHFLSTRMDFGVDEAYLTTAFMDPNPFNPLDFITMLLIRIDWPLMVGGWAFALVAVWLASEYRRRSVDN